MENELNPVQKEGYYYRKIEPVVKVVAILVFLGGIVVFALGYFNVL